MAIRQLAATCIAVILSVVIVLSQNVGIGTSTPRTSAQLEVNSTTKGNPGYQYDNHAKRISISNPATGLLVFDLNKKQSTCMIGTGGCLTVQQYW